ncbi:hypothetical protein HY441_01400 [Candidatus Microgenomates bacterium]|nr:hypothetical protein [Candidatus Microgenomates bacterium]
MPEVSKVYRLDEQNRLYPYEFEEDYRPKITGSLAGIEVAHQDPDQQVVSMLRYGGEENGLRQGELVGLDLRMLPLPTIYAAASDTLEADLTRLRWLFGGIYGNPIYVLSRPKYNGLGYVTSHFWFDILPDAQTGDEQIHIVSEQRWPARSPEDELVCQRTSFANLDRIVVATRPV